MNPIARIDFIHTRINITTIIIVIIITSIIIVTIIAFY